MHTGLKKVLTKIFAKPEKGMEYVEFTSMKLYPTAKGKSNVRQKMKYKYKPQTTNDKSCGTHAGNSSRFTKQTPVIPTPLKRLKSQATHLGSFPSNSPCQLDVLGHDGNPFCVNGTQVSVLKQSNQVCFTGLLHENRHVRSNLIHNKSNSYN